MGYGSKSLSDLAHEAHQIAVAHGFTDNEPGTDIALMHSELSEALEDIRTRGLDEFWYEQPDKTMTNVFWPDGSKPNKPCGVRSELADVIIRVLHFSARHNIDIEQAVREKMLYNETRPFKHGGKKF